MRPCSTARTTSHAGKTLRQATADEGIKVGGYLADLYHLVTPIMPNVQALGFRRRKEWVVIRDDASEIEFFM